MSYRASKANFLPPPHKNEILKDPNTRQDSLQRYWIIQRRPEKQKHTWALFDSNQWSDNLRIGYCVYNNTPPQENDHITINEQHYIVQNVYATKKKSWTILNEKYNYHCPMHNCTWRTLC